MKKDVISIIFAINDGYIKQLATVITSILKNSNANTAFEFIIMSTDLSKEHKNKLKKLSCFNANISFSFIDMNKVIKNFDLEKFMSRRKDYTYISIETYFRFFIPELLPNHDKVLYLDADILVFEDIRNLYNSNIDNYYAGVMHDNWMELRAYNDRAKMEASLDTTYQNYFKTKLEKDNLDYFNAGVLLLNLKEIRKDKIVDKLWNFARDKAPLMYQDQDVLNAVLDKKVKYLEHKWNVLKGEAYSSKKFNYSERNQLKEEFKNPAIFHYVGASKPWKLNEYENCQKNHIEDWWEYFKLTPFFEESDSKEFAKVKKLVSSRIRKTSDPYHDCFEILNVSILGKELLHIFASNGKFRIILCGIKIYIPLPFYS